MSSLIRKLGTIVGINYDLDTVELGETVFLQHDEGNEFDKFAMKAYRGTNKDDIGFLSASKHTTLEGCSTNREMFKFIPSKNVPLVGKVIDKENISMKNGTIAVVLKIEMKVTSKKIAV